MTDPVLLATTVWTVVQPLLQTLVKAGTKEIEKSVQDVWDIVRAKFDSKSVAREVLEDLIRDPDNPIIHNAFQYQLQKFIQDDQLFSDELTKLSRSIQPTFMAKNTEGAIAQGSGSNAVGKGGILIQGNVTGNVNTGNSKE